MVTDAPTAAQGELSASIWTGEFGVGVMVGVKVIVGVLVIVGVTVGV
jgi:hypothetical protein